MVFDQNIFFQKSFKFRFIKLKFDAFKRIKQCLTKSYIFQNLMESGLLGTNMLLLGVENSFQKILKTKLIGVQSTSELKLERTLKDGAERAKFAVNSK